jgi:hypothetical protein
MMLAHPGLGLNPDCTSVLLAWGKCVVLMSEPPNDLCPKYLGERPKVL